MKIIISQEGSNPIIINSIENINIIDKNIKSQESTIKERTLLLQKLDEYYKNHEKEKNEDFEILKSSLNDIKKDILKSEVFLNKLKPFLQNDLEITVSRKSVTAKSTNIIIEYKFAIKEEYIDKTLMKRLEAKNVSEVFANIIKKYVKHKDKFDIIAGSYNTDSTVTYYDVYYKRTLWCLKTKYTVLLSRIKSLN